MVMLLSTVNRQFGPFLDGGAIADVGGDLPIGWPPTFAVLTLT
jgi:hypothetical protein